VELARGVPSGSVEQQDGMSPRSDVARDFVEVKLHHVGVGQGKGRPDAAGGADGAEQIGGAIALVGRLARSGSAPGPLPNLAVFLPMRASSSNQISTGVVSGSP
jgi:hypothetical protein